MHTHVPEIAGADEQGDSLHIPVMDGTSFPVAFQEWRPAYSNCVFKTATPKENSQIVCPVTETATVEVEKGQHAIWGQVGMVTLQITVAAALLEHFSRHRQNPLAQRFSELLEKIPIIRPMGQERLNIAQRLVDKVGEIQVEARVRTIEIVEGVVHLGYSPPVASCIFYGRVIVGNLRAWGLGEECQDTPPLRGRYGTKRLTIFVRHRPGSRKTFAIQMVEHIQLILDISQRAPLEAVSAQVVGAAIGGFNPVGMVETARVELALDNWTYSKTRQNITDECLG